MSKINKDSKTVEFSAKEINFNKFFKGIKSLYEMYAKHILNGPTFLSQEPLIFDHRVIDFNGKKMVAIDPTPLNFGETNHISNHKTSIKEAIEYAGMTFIEDKYWGFYLEDLFKNIEKVEIIIDEDNDVKDIKKFAERKLYSLREDFPHPSSNLYTCEIYYNYKLSEVNDIITLSSWEDAPDFLFKILRGNENG